MRLALTFVGAALSLVWAAAFVLFLLGATLGHAEQLTFLGGIAVFIAIFVGGAYLYRRLGRRLDRVIP
jgi:hypothetical protein